jgi:hypothetical protein
MNTFEITVQRKAAAGWPVVAEQTASGVFLPARAEGLLEADLEELRTQLLSQASAKDYGTLLGRALFRDDVRDAFGQALPRGDDRLHVLLFVEDAELKGLRWERLCAPLDGGWDFLALNQRVPFSLYLPSTTDQRFPPIGRRDLRALVVVANPQGLKEYRLALFDAAAAVAGVRASLGSIPSDVLAAVPGAVGPPTLDALCERITAERYTLLHVVAHGQFKPADGETVLFLANAENQVDPVPGAVHPVREQADLRSHVLVGQHAQKGQLARRLPGAEVVARPDVLGQVLLYRGSPAPLHLLGRQLLPANSGCPLLRGVPDEALAAAAVGPADSEGPPPACHHAIAHATPVPDRCS